MVALIRHPEFDTVMATALQRNTVLRSGELATVRNALFGFTHFESRRERRKGRKAARRLSKRLRLFVFEEATAAGVITGDIASVDWDSLADFIAKILPLILQFITGLI